MKTKICYTSNTGFTETYAGWLGESLKNSPARLKEVSRSDLAGLELVIYAAPVHAGRIAKLGRVRRMVQRLGGTKLIIIAVGASEDDEENTGKLLGKNFPGGLQEDTSFFYLRGGMNYGELKGFMKWMMGTFRNATMKKDPAQLSEDEKEMLASFEHPVDHSSREFLVPVLEYVTSLETITN